MTGPAGLQQIRQVLISEVGLDPQEAGLYLLITVEGPMPAGKISERMGLPEAECIRLCERMVQLGAFIAMSATEFEAMHPRFTAVNMYRRMCMQKGLKFGRNKAVDGIGVVLERHYDSARINKVGQVGSR